MIPKLGRIEEVPLREVWNNEATSFTPWLLENEDVLSVLLGMDLSLERREESVGRFSLDLIGRNNEDGSTLIIENQLEKTDHNHLGQLLTYAGGLDAKAIVWVSSEFRDEHRAALDWLNRVTNENTHFYGVEVRAVRIGDSLPAPNLSLVVEPNSFGETVRASSDSRWMEERGNRYREFWGQVFPKLEHEFPELKGRTAYHRQHITMPSGVKGCIRAAAFNRNSLRTEIYFGSGDSELNTARFDALYEVRTEIEDIYGEELSWEELEGKKATRIAFYRNASILEESSWAEYVRWLDDHLSRLTNVTTSEVFRDAIARAES